MTKYPLQTTCLAVICGTPVLSLLFVALRIYARRKPGTRLGWDDWLIIAATALSFALIGPSYRHVKMWHVGMHIWEVDQRHLEPSYDDYYAVLLSFNLLNIPILPIVKTSIILLLLRVGSVIRSVRVALTAVLIFNLGAFIIPWCFMIFMCPPMTGNTWKPRTFGGLHCMGRHRMGQLQIFITSANLLTDLLIFPIPIVIMRRATSASLRARLVITFLFGSSLAVTAIGGAKIYLSYRDRLYTLYKPDWTYPIDYCINHIENNVAIIVATVPTLKGLMGSWMNKAKSTISDLEWSIRGTRSNRKSRYPLTAAPRMRINSDPAKRPVHEEVWVTKEVKVTTDSLDTVASTTSERYEFAMGEPLASINSGESRAPLFEDSTIDQDITPLPRCIQRGWRP